MSLLDATAIALVAVAVVSFVTVHRLVRVDMSRRAASNPARTRRRAARDRAGADVERSARPVGRAGGPTGAGELTLSRDVPLTRRHAPDDEALGITRRDGPAPRGLDRLQASIDAGKITVNTGLLAVGPPIGTNTTGQVADGPHCVG